MSVINLFTCFFGFIKLEVTLHQAQLISAVTYGGVA